MLAGRFVNQASLLLDFMQAYGPPYLWALKYN